MSTPGAVMSGLMAPSPMRGPTLEKSASWSSRSTAPTVSAASALPGEPTVPSCGPELPAAITKSVPYCSDSELTASSSGSTSGVSPPPRLRFAMSAPCSAAHCMPAMIPDSRAEAAVVEHLAVQNGRAPGDAAVLAAGLRAGAGDDRGDVRAVAEVVDVVGRLAEVLLGDLPVGEVRVGLVDAGVEHRDLDALAGVAGLPRGGRADLRHAVVQQGLPLAVEPDPGHAGRLVRVPVRAVVPAVSAFQAAPDLSAATAIPSTLGRFRVTFATRGAARPAACVTISGTVARCASS